MINKNSFDKNREIFFLIFSAIIAGSIVGGRALSYQGTITHPSLTGNIAKIYNANFDRKLSYDEINWLEQGSVKEDLAPRWLNHYYNSENGTGLGSMMSSRDWAQSPNYQAVAAVFSGGNQTWQKAIESYAKGDMREAFYALGHVLHLLEDATVPAHTRLDAHPEGDVYENYVFNKAGENINFSVAPMAVSSLDSAFFDLATYSSGNFLSKDTIKSADLKIKMLYLKNITVMFIGVFRG